MQQETDEEHQIADYSLVAETHCILDDYDNNNNPLLQQAIGN